jgi:putative ABC transport system ATP-binding protein
VSETLVELVGVRRKYRFGDSIVSALDGLDLTITKGEFVAIIGRSGSGKSTLLNILGGLDRPTEGEVLIGGTPLHRRNSDALATYRRETVGFIFQSFNLINHLTAEENVAMPLRLAGELGFFERRRVAKELLENVGLSGRTGHKPAELSGGERQRVAIARALANDPKLLLADEPTGNLDSKTAVEIMGMIRDLHKKGRTVILVTHDQPQAERYCERVIVLEDGKLKEDRKANADDAKAGGSEETAAQLEAEVAALREELALVKAAADGNAETERSPE